MIYLTTGELGRWKNLISWVNFSLNRDIKAIRKTTGCMGPCSWAVRVQVLDQAM